MRQILKHEFYKVFSSRTILIVMFVVFVLNIARMFYMEYGAKDKISVTEYNREWQKVREYAAGKSSEELLAWAEAELSEEVFAELKTAYGHEEYIDGIDESAKRLTTLSFFADENSFTYRNALKTQEVFSGLRGILISVNPSRGIEVATDSRITDIAALFFILYMGITLWCREGESNIKLLIRTTPSGRQKLGLVKLLVMLMGSALAVLVLHGSNFAMAAGIYGIGNLSMPVIMLEKYSASTLNVSLGTFIVLYFIYKMLVYIWSAFLISMLCNLAGNTVFSCFAIATAVGVSALLFYGVSPVSYLAPFGILNLFGLLNDDLFFKIYRNLNFFGYPIDVRLCFIILLLLGFICFGAVSVSVFSKKQIRVNAKYREWRIRRIYNKMRRFFESHTGLWRHEGYKVMISQKLLIILILVIGLQMYRYQPFEVRYMQPKEYYLRYYLEMLSGPATEEKFKFVEEEEARLKKIEKESRAIQSLGMLSKELEIELDKAEAMKLLTERCEYLKQNEGAYFIYDKGFEVLTAKNGNNHDLLLAVIVFILISGCIPCVHAPDIQSGICRVTSASRFGRKKADGIRLGLVLLLGALSYLVAYVPEFAQLWLSYELQPNMFTYPVNSLPWLCEFGKEMSIGMYLFLVYFVRFVAVVTLAAAVGALSKKIGNVSYSIVVAVVITLIPTFIALSDKKYTFVYIPFSPFAGNMYVKAGVAVQIILAIGMIVLFVFSIYKNRYKSSE